MKKIAYIGHSFHQKTLSTKFLIELLEDYYKVDFYWTLPMDCDRELDSFNLNSTSYSALIFFQSIPEVKNLEKLTCQNIIIIPMFDNDLSLSYSYWNIYYKYKFINFSKILWQKLSLLNFSDNLYIQYAPEVINTYNTQNKKVRKKPKIFFWPRSEQINWKLMKEILDVKQIHSIHIHRIEVDPNKDYFFEMPSEEDIKKYNISFSSWFNNKKELLDKMADSDIFIAPRLFEGIGQTFLEAMALGKCVISPDLPTMNEYIQNEYNGILYDFTLPSKINLDNFLQLGQSAQETIQKVHNKWQQDKYKIIDLIEKENLQQSISYSEYRNILDSSLKIQNNQYIENDIKINFAITDRDKDKDSKNFSLYLNKIHTFFKQLDSQEHYILYGAGTGAELVLSIIPDNISFIVDKDKEKQKQKINDKKIYPLNQLTKTNQKIIISVFGRSANIIKFLNSEYGINNDRIISLDW
jgi:glycosyltransferase involved in cell wall biosynthesis